MQEKINDFQKSLTLKLYFQVFNQSSGSRNQKTNCICGLRFSKATNKKDVKYFIEHETDNNITLLYIQIEQMIRYFNVLKKNTTRPF